MNAQQQDLLKKAYESLDAAKLLKSNQFLDYATARAYYTMFYLAEAFLEGEKRHCKLNGQKSFLVLLSNILLRGELSP